LSLDRKRRNSAGCQAHDDYYRGGAPNELTQEMQREFDSRCLDAAIAEARLGLAEGGVPVGAALAVAGEVLATGRNRRVQLGSVIRHGEMDCLENAGRLPAAVYARATMYTTLSPCPMCAGAVLLYGIPRVVLGENHTFRGAEAELASHGVEVVNLDSAACADLMREFIAAHPDVWNEDVGR
jgi:cytosine/creatinine deaminase